VHATGIDPGQVEQIRRELREPVRLLAHPHQELTLRLRIEILVLHQLEEAAEREDGRAELVRGVRYELASRTLETGEALAHPLECGGELAHLVGSAIRDGLAEVPARNPFRGTLETSEAAGEQRGEPVPDRHGRDQRDDPRDQEAMPHEGARGGRVSERRAEKENGKALVTRDRQSDLGDPLVVALYGARRSSKRSQGGERDRILTEVAGEPTGVGHGDERLRVELREDAHPRVRRLLRP
jgi:hypothetical protein